MKLVLASDNKNKLREFRTLFENFGVELISKAESGFTEEVEETGETFAENARIKAEAVMRATGLAAVADDSGLCVDALGGAPGVHSARYTGNHDDSDADRYNLLLRNLGGRDDRAARFVCSLCCAFPNGDILTAEGTCEGTILSAPRGENGFGYDPVFRPDGFDRSMAELTMEEKNAISHRGKALAQLDRNGRNTMITSKQRAQLRGMAAALNTELQIGKSGITENVARQAEEALAARELIKGRVLDNSLLSAREACDALCEACGADGVQVIGSKFVLFKQNEKDPKIVLINDRKGKK